MQMPVIKIPIVTTLLANANIFLDMGTATSSLSIKGRMDDSTAANAEIEGGFELAFNAMALGIEAIVGVDDVLCAAAEAKLEAGYFTVGAKLLGDTSSKTIYLIPEAKTGQIKASYDLKIKYKGSNSCTLDKGEYPLIDEETYPFPPVIIYSNN